MCMLLSAGEKVFCEAYFICSFREHKGKKEDERVSLTSCRLHSVCAARSQRSTQNFTRVLQNITALLRGRPTRALSGDLPAAKKPDAVLIRERKTAPATFICGHIRFTDLFHSKETSKKLQTHRE